LKYRLKGPLSFDEVPQLNALLRAALVAANRGQWYREVVDAVDQATGRTFKIYLAVIYDDTSPVEIEVGEDLPPDFSPSLTAGLKDAGVAAFKQQPWSSAPLVQRRRSFAEWWHDLWA